jgi:Icc-related predicted phosphoesterase
MIRIAAVGDVHFGVDSAGTLRPYLDALDDHADLFLLAGDLTRVGTEREATVLARELSGVTVPTVAVLGNHDFHSDEVGGVQRVLSEAGITVLEGGTHAVRVNGTTVGVAGIKGFGGGFAGACGSDFGEAEMKSFIHHTKCVADSLRDALESLRTDVRIALMHYAPVKDTLSGERLEIFPFLGSYLLGEAVDAVGADLVVHGHAHGGTESGVTPAGINVRNVAQPVIRRSYRLYCLDGHSDPAPECAAPSGVGAEHPAPSRSIAPTLD